MEESRCCVISFGIWCESLELHSRFSDVQSACWATTPPPGAIEHAHQTDAFAARSSDLLSAKQNNGLNAQCRLEPKSWARRFFVLLASQASMFACLLIFLSDSLLFSSSSNTRGRLVRLVRRCHKMALQPNSMRPFPIEAHYIQQLRLSCLPTGFTLFVCFFARFLAARKKVRQLRRLGVLACRWSAGQFSVPFVSSRIHRVPSIVKRTRMGSASLLVRFSRDPSRFSQILSKRILPASAFGMLLQGMLTEKQGVPVDLRPGLLTC